MTKRIFISCFEPSGDAIAARTIPFLRQQFGECIFFGLTGALLAEECVTSWYSIDLLSTMGIRNIMFQAPKLLKIISDIAYRLDNDPPDIILTVDAPEFHVRLVERISNHHSYRAQIVSPSVWAWRKHRIKRFANAFHVIYCIFPFEPRYYHNFPIKAVYVGHPARCSNNIQVLSEKQFKQQYGMKMTICLLPGSRRDELKLLRQDFFNICKRLYNFGDYHLLLPTFPHYVEEINQWWTGKQRPILITDPIWRDAAIRYSNAALCCLGTVEIELSLCKTPHLAIYRFRNIDYFLLKFFKFNINHAAMSNILIDQQVIGEYIHHNIDHEQIAYLLTELVHKRSNWIQQQQAMTQISNILTPPNKSLHFAECLSYHLKQNYKIK